MRENLVFNIQRYSLHDGGGIRTIIFFKGCPLTCPWCSNPESQSFNYEVIRKQSQCILCISNSCFSCQATPEECPTGALELIGENMTINQIMDEVKKDMIFYESTSGGVTLSGGEPLSQKDFIVDLLIQLKDLGIHTAVETTGIGSWELIDRVSDYVDLFLFDLKIMDKNRSMDVVNADIEKIKNNFSRLVKKGVNIIPRIPLVPGYTMDDENIQSITEFVVSQQCQEIHILPFHQFGSNKYINLGRDYELEGVNPPTDYEVDLIKSYMELNGLKVVVGG